MDVLQGVVDLVAPALSSEQEKGLADAIDEADKGDLVDGAAAFAKRRMDHRGPSRSELSRCQPLDAAGRADSALDLPAILGRVHPLITSRG
jgi:hypothetical protein